MSVSVPLPKRARLRLLSDLFFEHSEELHRRAASGAPAGATTGVPGLDAHVSPLTPGRASVIASQPGVGRTTLALQIALRNAWTDYLPVYLSNTLREREIVERALILENEFGADRSPDDRSHDPDWGRLARTADQPHREMIVADGVDTLDDLLLVVERTTAPRWPGRLVVVDGIDRFVDGTDAGHGAYERLREVTAQHPATWVFTLRLAAKRAAQSLELVDILIEAVPDDFAGTLILLEPGSIRGVVVAHVVRSNNGPTGSVEMVRRDDSPRLHGSG